MTLQKWWTPFITLWAIALVVVSPHGARAQDEGIFGQWKNQENTANILIQLAPDGTLEGEIAPGGRALREDKKNPDESLRKRPLLGIKLMWGFKPTSSKMDVWTGGHIYDPKTGNTYSSSLRLINGELHIKGFVGAEWMGLGRTTVWSRGYVPPEVVSP